MVYLDCQEQVPGQTGEFTMIQETYIVKRLKEQSGFQRSLHFHDVFELFFSLNDGCSFFLGDRVYNVNRGVVFLIPEGTIHRKINPPNVMVNSYAIHFPTEFLEAYSTPQSDLVKAFSSNIASIQLPQSEIQNITHIFEQCADRNPGLSFGWDIQQNIRLLELLLTIYPFIPKTYPSKMPVSYASTHLAADVIHYINLHLTEHLSLDHLAKKFFVSKYNLCRQFKKETSFTIIQYINSNRIRLACSIIREEGNITNICTRVGFSNASHFINTFRQYTGVTPRAYLKRYASSVSAPMFGNYTSRPFI